MLIEVMSSEIEHLNFDVVVYNLLNGRSFLQKKIKRIYCAEKYRERQKTLKIKNF